MKLAHHYRTLGLRRSASFSDVKKAYRRLVRQCHPDVHPGQAATERFIQINTAYTALCEALQLEEDSAKTKEQPQSQTAQSDASSKQTERLNLKDLKRTLEKLGLGNFQQDTEQTAPQTADQKTQATSEPAATAGTHPAAADETAASAQVADASTASTKEDTELKKEAYDQLRDLLRQQKFPRAIALVEGLAHRLPADAEINQWQAIVYQRWGRQLISQGQFHKAHLYLKKALQTDPNNPSLSNEVARDLGLLKHIQAAEATLSQP